MNHYHPVSVKFNPKFVHMTQCMKIIVNDMTAKRAMPKEKIHWITKVNANFRAKVRSPTYVRGEKIGHEKNIRGMCCDSNGCHLPRGQ